MFHCLARSGADLLIGVAGAAESRPAWLRVYRALEHGHARSACLDVKAISDFPIAIREFADIFVDMQIKRHAADYDPMSRFKKSEVEEDITVVERCLRAFVRAPVKDKTAFCAHVLFRKR